MEMNSVMATEIVAAEVEHIVLPQIVSIKQASRMLGLDVYKRQKQQSTQCNGRD